MRGGGSVVEVVFGEGEGWGQWFLEAIFGSGCLEGSYRVVYKVCWLGRWRLNTLADSSESSDADQRFAGENTPANLSRKSCPSHGLLAKAKGVDGQPLKRGHLLK